MNYLSSRTAQILAAVVERWLHSRSTQHVSDMQLHVHACHLRPELYWVTTILRFHCTLYFPACWHKRWHVRITAHHYWLLSSLITGVCCYQYKDLAVWKKEQLHLPTELRRKARRSKENSTYSHVRMSHNISIRGTCLYMYINLPKTLKFWVSPVKIYFVFWIQMQIFKECVCVVTKICFLSYIA